MVRRTQQRVLRVILFELGGVSRSNGLSSAVETEAGTTHSPDSAVTHATSLRCAIDDILKKYWVNLAPSIDTLGDVREP